MHICQPFRVFRVFRGPAFIWHFENWNFDIVPNFDFTKKEVLPTYIKRIRNVLVSYMVKPEKSGIEKLLGKFIHNDELSQEEITPEEETLLRDMVRQNILYFDPTEAKYYPQGKSFHNGIKAYFERRTSSIP